MDERELYPRHFSDVFGSVNDGQEKLHHSDTVHKLRRRPNCKSKNKYTDESFELMLENSCYKATLFAVPKSCTPSLANGYTDTQTAECSNASVRRSERLPVFDILCSSLQCTEHVTSHQVIAVSRWLSCPQVIKTAKSSLMQILMASDSPLISVICCRLLKQSQSMLSVRAITYSQNARSSLGGDVLSNVLMLQKEMVNYLQSQKGKFSITLLNVVCLLDSITAHNDKPTHSKKLQVCTSRWSSTELRWAALTVMKLAEVVAAKMKLRSLKNDDYVARCARLQVERVPQIARIILAKSVSNEIAQASNVFRILNEYWHTTNFDQHRLIVESILVPKLRMELCVMILAGHCEVLLREYFATCLSLDDILSIFSEDVVISAVTQRVWMDDAPLIISHCQGICFVLCSAVCSYILHQRETQGHLSDNDMMSLQRLPEYAATVKKRLSNVCVGDYIMDAVSVSALDRLSCLADIYNINP